MVKKYHKKGPTTLRRHTAALTLMDILSTILQAFENVKLNGAYSIRQCIALDNRKSPDDEEFLHIIDYEKWWDIPAEQIEKVGTHGIFVHGGDDGLKFHLPAAMSYIAKQYEGFGIDDAAENVYSVTLLALESKSLPSMLNSTQIAAVIAFLEFMDSKLKSRSVVVEPNTVLNRIRS